MLWRQIKSPLLLLLVLAAGMSLVAGEWRDAAIVQTIVLATVAIGYSREYRAHRDVESLVRRARTRVSVLRNGETATVSRDEIVPGDVVLLSAGSLVPADGLLLDATDLFVSESVLTGESFPVEKRAGLTAAEADVSERSNCLFLGTNVRSGFGRMVVVSTGAATELGAIAAQLSRPAPETDFDRGLRHFGYLLTSAMLVLVLVVFTIHVAAHRPPIEVLLFSIALAVGLSPELLPAILTANLARGAHMMARRGVLVRRLNAIENLGSMNVLCTDKTGTLTEGVVRIEGAYDVAGTVCTAVLDIAALNAALDSGLSNPLDEAILNAKRPDLKGVRKLAEIPFDFVRRRVSIVVARKDASPWLITKGAVNSILPICDHLPDGARLDASMRERIAQRVEQWNCQGIRVLAVAVRDIDERGQYARDDETGCALQGFLTFSDPPKAGVNQAVEDLNRLGVRLKIITGDSAGVATHVARLVGLPAEQWLTGHDLTAMDDAALFHAVDTVSVFAEVDPNQKERIIVALKRRGHTVGFLGDGVNDAPAMHVADTSLSVDQAVDVAREAADFVLLERDLDVIRGGIEEGRRTFANTLKYILTTTSANLGNMISMAFASLFLPFLPLTAGQILLNNLLSDVPAVGIADDSVDAEMVERPPRWDMRFIGWFMLEFGLLSSAFDFLTFGVLLWGFRVSVPEFRTGWFTESLLTELTVALVVRTRRPALRSRPGALLLWSSVVMIGVALVLPHLPYAGMLGFVPLPACVLIALVALTALYLAAVELNKTWFYARPGLAIDRGFL